MAINFDEFIAKHNGKGIDFDGYAGFQCFDLYRAYCQEVLDVPQSPPTGDAGAVKIWDTYLTEHFDRIENTPSGIPQKGDICIWGTEVGKYGHVDVFIEGDTNSFKGFDQNWPVGTLCHIQTHTYKGLLGWLHPKASLANTPEPGVIKDLTLKVDFGEPLGIVELSTIKSRVVDSEKQIELLQADNQGYQKTVADLTKQLQECQHSHPVVVEVPTTQPPQTTPQEPDLTIPEPLVVFRLPSWLKRLLRIGDDEKKTSS